MSKKTLYKAVSLLVVFSVLALSFPNAANARDNNARLTFSQLINHPVDFFVSLFPFLQKNQQPANTHDTYTQDNNTVQKTGDLDIDRPSRDG